MNQCPDQEVDILYIEQLRPLVEDYLTVCEQALLNKKLNLNLIKFLDLTTHLQET